MEQRSKRAGGKPNAASRHVAAPAPASDNAFPKVSVIIPAMNEQKTIAAVIAQAQRVHPATEVIVIVNGSADETEQIARSTGAKVFVFGEPLGHDVGRGIGAMHAQGEVLLFIDSDMVIPSAELEPFVSAVERGVDVALNKYSGPTLTKRVHPVVLAKHTLNLALSRPDLRGASMTAVPHAISRRALELIGVRSLAVPPLAQTIAARRGLTLQTVHKVDVGRLNPKKRKSFRVDPLQDLIVGDHLEAIEWLLAEAGERGQQTDLSRDRSFVG